jgi:DNA helicase-2/ATP-dependent DNA helicase PcrA
MLTLTDAGIVEVGARLGLDLSDDKIQEILRCGESRDVQACPGSGKTSVLATKLVLLAERWSSADNGICVLSHTNVARDEIERRLRSSKHGTKLLRQPHFIGTIQSFVDRFLAMPYVRSTQLRFEAIDEERHANIAKAIFSKQRYNCVRAWLGRKNNLEGKVEDFAGQVEFIGSLEQIRHASITLPKPETDTYKSLIEIKKAVAERGIYRYHDMFALAHCFIDENEWVLRALHRRFPVVFIDEVQDTSRLQFALLNKLFDPATIVVQRFGDSDQAIYGSMEREDSESYGDEFPRGEPLTLDSSRRFGPFIASQVSALSFSSQHILGKSDGSSVKRNTLFLFKPETIANVLPAFARLVLEEFTGEVVSANAVGRRRKPGAGEAVPVSIGDYWHGYDGSASVHHPFTGLFSDQVAKALSALLSGESFADASRHLWSRINDWARKLGADNLTDVARILRSDAVTRSVIGGAFYELLSKGEFPGDLVWRDAIRKIERTINALVGAPVEVTAATFAGYPETLPIVAPRGAQVYEYSADGRIVRIDMDTIHGVKSQTHAATILLETKIRAFDLKYLIPFLSGSQSVGQETPNDSVAAIVRCGFVAISRPQSLLCLAMNEEHIKKLDRRKMQERGWDVVDLV